MSPRLRLFSQAIEQEQRRWEPFRPTLAKDDQARGDKLFDDAKGQLQAVVLALRPRALQLMVMAVLLEHEKRLEQVRRRLEAVSAEKRLPDGNPPDGR
jgi:hypothetical protein